MKEVLLDKDINSEVLKGKRIAVIGYGSQGHAHSLNLKESGFDVVVGLKETSKSVKVAQENGLEVKSVANAVKDADIVMMLVPDEVLPELYENEIKDNLKNNATLAVAHGFNIHFKQLDIKQGMQVFMVAPKSPGHLVRRQYQNNKGVPSLYAATNEDPQTLELAKAYAKAIGSGRSGILHTTFQEEVETDLFGEQAVLCGGVVDLMLTGFEVLTEAGYSEEMAYFECMNEMKLIVDLIYEGGIQKMNESISNTAEYGEYVSGPRVITSETKKAMKEVLKDIQTGEFAKDFILENKANNVKLYACRNKTKNHPAEKVGAKLRSLMQF
ncbi:ketol-acid reductoisomerase [Mycoplasma sp. P36-A1]|uniref:ketol-acid reductoisomerase n=1 Tax=Mycoplasma sp. P36-A1 TaxID=3252900 RepID=UPI003C30D3C8